MSGAGTPTTTQSLTGNLSIDGLLSGTKWNASSITYSNPDAAADYQVGYYEDLDGDGIDVLNDGFGQINASQLVALQSVLDSARFGTFAPGGGVFAVEGFTNLSISAAAAGSGSGTIRVANSTDWTTGYASYPSSSPKAGDVFINNTYSSIGTPEVGNYGWQTMLHEVGHALGLKHGDEGTYTLPTSVDTLEYSVVSQKSYVGDLDYPYNNGAYSYPQTFMQLDILALQTMYGANYNTNNTNTTYTWNTADGTMSINGQVALDPAGTGSSGNKIFATVWDGGGGQDVYDLSNFTTAVNIDLAPGAFSTIDPNRLASLGSGNYARGNIANALLFNGDTRSLIERAYGGSGDDTLKGNVGGNRLEGNNGNDSLFGYDAIDYLIGGAGNDTLDGGTGNDLMDGGLGDDNFYVDSIFDSMTEASGQGYDTIYASSKYTLSSTQYIEQMILTGSGNNSLTGNSYNQRLVGNSGENRLQGELGNDTLRGEGGADKFVFSTALSVSNVDAIEDFNGAQGDKIELSRSVFANLNAGSTLDASAFVLGTAALDADDRVIYDSSVGYLSYDSDGSGFGAGDVVFATLTPGTALTASNFVLI